MSLLQTLHFGATLPFPVSREKKQEYLTVAGERAATLAERIEDFTGKPLDYQGVKDIKEYFAAMRADAHPDLPITRRIAYILLSARNRIKLFRQAEHGYFMQYLGTIYALFGSATKELFFYEGTRHRFLDSMLLHELGHTLWEAVGGERAPAIWEEGFATYCALDWFSKLGEGEPFMSQHDNYCFGRALIKSIVKQHGKRVLFDIPRNWHAYEQ